MLLETLVYEVTVPNNLKGTNRRWTLKGIYDGPFRRLEPHIIDSPLYSSVSVGRASHRLV